MTAETAEERDARLETLRAAQQERLAVETTEERDAKLETAEERDARLETQRAAQQERLAVETTEERDAKLETAEERDTRLETQRAAQQERLAVETAEERVARQRHDRDWHSERSVQTKTLKFHSQISSLSCPQCTTCSEKFPGLRIGCHSAECMRCCQDKHIPKLYSSANNMDPGPIPPQLQVGTL